MVPIKQIVIHIEVVVTLTIIALLLAFGRVLTVVFPHTHILYVINSILILFLVELGDQLRERQYHQEMRDKYEKLAKKAEHVLNNNEEEQSNTALRYVINVSKLKSKEKFSWGTPYSIYNFLFGSVVFLLGQFSVGILSRWFFYVK